MVSRVTRITGKQEDSTGFYYFGVRYYDPEIGRFVTRDTLFGDLTDPQSQNRYVYCMNNPHKYKDPDGKMANVVIGAISGAGLNLAFYFFELSLLGGKFEWREAKIRMGTGLITGAIAGATFGLSLGYGSAIDTLTRTSVNLLGSTVVIGVEDSLRNDPTYESDSDNQILTDTSQGIVLDTTSDVFVETGLETFDPSSRQYEILKTIDSSALFVGPLITNSVMLLDKWWDQEYIPSSSVKDFNYDSNNNQV